MRSRKFHEGAGGGRKTACVFGLRGFNPNSKRTGGPPASRCFRVSQLNTLPLNTANRKQDRTSHRHVASLVCAERP